MDRFIERFTAVLLILIGILILLMSVSNIVIQKKMNWVLIGLFSVMFLAGLGVLKLGIEQIKKE